MKFRKLTTDSKVRYVSKDDRPHSEQAPSISKERDNKPDTRKKKASNDKPLQKKKFIKNITGEGFRVIKGSQK